VHHDNRFAALDGMRGLAAIFVLLFHLGQWQYRPTLAANAGLAVDFFFTLSGYVLALAYAGRLDRQTIVFDKAPDDPRYSDHHTPRFYGLSSYSSEPIVVENVLGNGVRNRSQSDQGEKSAGS
jgi:hypothetical protein